MKYLLISIAVLALLFTVTGAFARTNNADNVTSDSSGVDSGIGDANISYGIVQGAAQTWSGYYNPPAGGALGNANAPSLPLAWFDQTATGPQDINVLADVVLWCSTYMDHTEAYFNVAGKVSSLNAVFNCTLDSNNGEWTGISAPLAKPACDIKKLTRTENYRGDAPTGTETIPLAWSLAELNPTTSTWTAYRVPDAVDTAGADGTILKATWWQLGGGYGDAGRNGHHNYLLMATITPAAFQKAGRYELDPTVVTSPDM